MFENADLVAPFSRFFKPTENSLPLEHFSFSILNNLIARELESRIRHEGSLRDPDVRALDHFLFLNDDVHAPPGSGFLHSMIRAHQEAEASEVGLKLVYPSSAKMAGRIQHAGHHRGAGGTGVHRGLYADPEAKAFSSPPWVQTWAVTGACVLVTPSDFWKVGGFDENYMTLWQDVDLSLALREATGRPVVCAQDSWIWHFEGATQGGRFDDHPWTEGRPDVSLDKDRFLKKWPPGRDVTCG